MTRRNGNAGGGADTAPSPAKNGSVHQRREGFGAWVYVALCAALFGSLVLCVCIGSVSISVGDALSTVWCGVWGLPTQVDQATAAILLTVRVPRVLCVALTGASLSLCGGAMQGLLKNPLADGSTLGVSAGASLGAALAIAFSLYIPVLPMAGTTALAMLFAFLSLAAILSLAYRLDRSLSTDTIILIGVIYTMFVSSILSFIITLAPEKLRSITFWTMGSLAGSTYQTTLLLLGALTICGAVILRFSRELNAFAIGEDNARSIGVDVRVVKLLIMVAVSALIGVCVSVGGAIGFVGLVTPHMTRLLTGPNHKRLLPASLFFGAVFLLLADLVARVALSPLELPVGVVTSFIGAILFITIFYRARRKTV